MHKSPLCMSFKMNFLQLFENVLALWLSKHLIQDLMTTKEWKCKKRALEPHKKV